MNNSPGDGKECVSEAAETSDGAEIHSSTELTGFCENTVVVTNHEESGCSSSNVPTIITTSGGHEVPIVSMSGGKPIFLSDQFTAVLIKPESLLYGLEVPLVKKEPGHESGSDIISVPTASLLPGEGVSVAQIPWLVPISQEADHGQHLKPNQSLQHPNLIGKTSVLIPHQTSPDSASATPDAPYMFECKDRSFTCEFCPNIRFTRGQLRRHKAVHQGQRNYSCDVCGKRFAWKHSLLKHTILHTGQSPFSCAQCGKGFSAAHHLQHHVKMHDSEKHYQCSTCEKTFTRPEELIVHARSHTGPETFSCEVCSKSFNSKFGLSTHIRVHGEPSGTLFSCGICGKQFSYYKGLINHAKVHDNQPGAITAGAGGRVVIVSGKDVSAFKPGLVPTTQSEMSFVPDTVVSSPQIVIDSRPEVIGQEVNVHTAELQQSVL